MNYEMIEFTQGLKGFCDDNWLPYSIKEKMVYVEHIETMFEEFCYNNELSFIPTED